MKRDYKNEPVAELIFEMKDGTTHYAFGTPIKSDIGIEADIFVVWTAEEFSRLSIEEKRTKPFAFYIPRSDLSAKSEGGFLSIYRANKLLFMFNRNDIKRILSGVNDCLVDFCEQL